MHATMIREEEWLPMTAIVIINIVKDKDMQTEVESYENAIFS